MRTYCAVVSRLIFSHLLADYVLQTDWLATRKGQFVIHDVHSWDGLLLHGLMVWLVSLAVFPQHIGDLWPYITLLAVIHTTQDGLKVWLSMRIKIHPFIPYALDQLLHLLTIFVFAAALRPETNPPLSPHITHIMMLGASLVAVTRLYEVSWWANWLDMLPYMNRWRLVSYIERTVALLLSAVGLWWLAPLAALPRLYLSQRAREPLWQQPRGTLELALGIGFSVILGSAL